MFAPPIAVVDGEILVYEVVDVADEVDLARAELELGASGDGGLLPRRLRLSPSRDAVVVSEPPLTVELGVKTIDLPGGERRVAARASVFAFGAVAVCYVFALAADSPLNEVAELVVELSRPAARARLTERQTADARALAARLGSALTERSSGVDHDSLLVVRIGGFNRVVTAADLAAHPLLAELALGERAPLSAQLHQQLAAASFSYTENDLVVVGYDQVLVVDPVSSSDIAILLEFALAQVVVLSAYERLLDERLRAAQAGLAAEGRTRNSLGLGRRRFDRLRHDLLRQQLELASVLEQITTAVKVTEDFYFANIYEAVMRVFRADALVRSTQRKLDLMFRTSRILADDHDARTTHRLEWIVILLIFFEIVLGLIQAIF